MSYVWGPNPLCRGCIMNLWLARMLQFPLYRVGISSWSFVVSPKLQVKVIFLVSLRQEMIPLTHVIHIFPFKVPSMHRVWVFLDHFHLWNSLYIILSYHKFDFLGLPIWFLHVISFLVRMSLRNILFSISSLDIFCPTHYFTNMVSIWNT